MPDLDVSEVLLDPMFADTFSVTRQTQAVDSNGRSVLSTATFEVSGVVTIGSLQDFQQTTDYVNSNKAIVVHCQTRLLDPVNGFSPDIVLYAGDTYIVKKTYNWSRYGAGFFASECEQLTAVGAGNG